MVVQQRCGKASAVEFYAFDLQRSQPPDAFFCFLFIYLFYFCTAAGAAADALLKRQR